MHKVTKFIAAAALVASIGAAPVSYAQAVAQTDAEVAATCVATPDACEAAVQALLATLTGLTPAQRNARIGTLTVAIAEASSTAGITGANALRISSALRVAATASTDPALTASIVQIAQATEDGTFQTASIGQTPSPN